MVLHKFEVGDRVMFTRGGSKLHGDVVAVKRSTYHIRVGNDFLGYRTFAEQKPLVQPSAGEESGIDVTEE